MNQFDLNFCWERDFDLNFCQEKDFQANNTFSQKIRKGAPKMAGDREKKFCDRSKNGGWRPEMHWQIIGTLLLHIPLLALTDGQNDRQRDEYTCCTWAGGTFFSVVLFCQFFCFWQEIGFGCYLLRYLEYNTVVALCYFFGSGRK